MKKPSRFMRYFPLTTAFLAGMCLQGTLWMAMTDNWIQASSCLVTATSLLFTAVREYRRRAA